MTESGRIQLDGDVIRSRSAIHGDWDLPVADVRLIGEATDQSGPFADDYFLCFATGPGMWLEAPFYAEGRDVFLAALGARLGSPLEPCLCDSADFASRVLWPPPLAGEPLFRYEDVPPSGPLGRLFGWTQNRQTYTARVAVALRGGG